MTELRELREILETGALRMALARDRAGPCQVLSERLEEAEAAVAHGPAGYQIFASAFHEALVRASDNRELIEAYLKVSGRIRAVRFRITNRQERIVSAQKDHREITELILAGGHAEAERRLGHPVCNG